MYYIDVILNRFTMYRIVMYLLFGLYALAVTFSFLKVLPYNPLLMLLNAGIILLSCYAFSVFFSKIFKSFPNTESVYITAFILFLIMPIQLEIPWYMFVLVSAFAMGSKYILAIKKRHIFNPAAAGVFFIGLLSADAAATWWIGNPILFLPTLAVSFLVIRKTRRFTLVFTFLAAYLAFTSIIFLFQSSNVSLLGSSLFSTITSSALIFFASIMLTEPLTSPGTKKLQIYYAVLVAALFASASLQLPGIIITAELALLVGNIFSFIVSPKYRLELKLVETKKLPNNIYAFLFKKPSDFTFQPGQYMEWTLPHKKEDLRGNRRYFSIASSHTEDNLIISFRQYVPSSSFKSAMVNLEKGSKIIATKLSGEFVLPKDFSSPLVFVAGGIGITPFRSMVKYITDKKLQMNIVMFYLGKTETDFVFLDIFKAAEKYGVKTVKLTGHLDQNSIKEQVPDFKNRIFYISGPQIMVQNLSDELKKIGVKRVRKDFFPGYTER